MNYPVVNGAERDVFNSPEESIFYSNCLYNLVFSRVDQTARVCELGAGNGLPVVTAIIQSDFKGKVTGYELNAAAVEKANAMARMKGVDDVYQVVHRSFFDAGRPEADEILISDPPFLPSDDPAIMDPLLWGGSDGSDMYTKLIGLGYRKCMLLIASYSNPLRILSSIRDHGYTVQDFLVAPMTMGVYSREKPVWDKLMEMRSDGRAFCTKTHFLLAGVTLELHPVRKDVSLAAELEMVLTSLRY